MYRNLDSAYYVSHHMLAADFCDNFADFWLQAATAEWEITPELLGYSLNNSGMISHYVP